MASKGINEVTRNPHGIPPRPPSRTPLSPSLSHPDRSSNLLISPNSRGMNEIPIDKERGTTEGAREDAKGGEHETGANLDEASVGLRRRRFPPNNLIVADPDFAIQVKEREDLVNEGLGPGVEGRRVVRLREQVLDQGEMWLFLESPCEH